MALTRLPGKMLLPLVDKTLLGWVVEQVQRTRLVNRLVLANQCRKTR